MDRTKPRTALATNMANWELREQGWTIIPDGDPSFRVQATKGFTGQYSSHYDPDLRAVLVVLHSKLREALEI